MVNKYRLVDLHVCRVLDWRTWSGQINHVSADSYFGSVFRRKWVSDTLHTIVMRGKSGPFIQLPTSDAGDGSNNRRYDIFIQDNYKTLILRIILYNTKPFPLPQGSSGTAFHVAASACDT